jgi:hypothetical protein
VPAYLTDPQQIWQALGFHQQGLVQAGAVDPQHPSHDLLLAVQHSLQQMQLGGPLPLVGMDGLPLPPDQADVVLRALQAQAGGPVAKALGPSPFLDEQGLLTYLPDPVKVRAEAGHAADDWVACRVAC